MRASCIAEKQMKAHDDERHAIEGEDVQALFISF